MVTIELSGKLGLGKQAIVDDSFEHLKKAEEAALAYNKLAKRLFRDFAVLNLVGSI